MAGRSWVVGAVLLAALLLFFSSFSFQSLIGQSTIQTRNGQEYIASYLVVNRYNEQLDLIRTGQDYNGRTPANNITVAFTAQNPSFQIPFDESYEFTCKGLNPFAPENPLGYELWLPTQTGQLQAPFQFSVIKNGQTQITNVNVQASGDIVPLQEGSFLEVTGIGTYGAELPTSSSLALIRNQTNGQTYLITRSRADILMQEMGPGTAYHNYGACSQNIPSIDELITGQTTRQRLAAAIANSQYYVQGNFGALSINFDMPSGVYTWTFNISQITSQVTYWVPTSMANLILYNSQQGEPQITSFALVPIGGRTTQTFTVHNGDTSNGGTFTITAWPTSGPVVIDTYQFTDYFQPGESKTYFFDTLKTQSGSQGCIRVRASAFGRTVESESCAMTTGESDPEQDITMITPIDCEGILGQGSSWDAEEHRCLPPESAISTIDLILIGAVVLIGAYLLAQGGRKR